ncbi:MAG: hypothetical protein ACLS89_07055 [Collinsella sp.]
MTLRPFAIKQRDGISYLLGTVYDARGADDTLRTVEVADEKRQHAPARRQEALRRPRRGGRRLLRRIRPSAAHSTTRTAHPILY